MFPREHRDFVVVFGFRNDAVFQGIIKRVPLRDECRLRPSRTFHREAGTVTVRWCYGCLPGGIEELCPRAGKYSRVLILLI
jgi:hypothetical protein